jgi:hypothetical protein
MAFVPPSGLRTYTPAMQAWYKVTEESPPVCLAEKMRRVLSQDVCPLIFDALCCQ